MLNHRCLAAETGLSKSLIQRATAKKIECVRSRLFDRKEQRFYRQRQFARDSQLRLQG